jgi:hypothetical protein
MSPSVVIKHRQTKAFVSKQFVILPLAKYFDVFRQAVLVKHKNRKLSKILGSLKKIMREFWTDISVPYKHIYSIHFCSSD